MPGNSLAERVGGSSEMVNPRSCMPDDDSLKIVPAHTTTWSLAISLSWDGQPEILMNDCSHFRLQSLQHRLRPFPPVEVRSSVSSGPGTS
jgi:hypothetical protein